ncbi:MAG: RnfABCDGE type electron transport complex subunit G [Deltaproteobacteria bacterium]|nr:RnfABCDGE type electron transport complex subunit G [Deltaproteobacteria bacterium]MBW2171668.1 RnfABCDGE type electron transport complex subunit G [Deltaproteobacteria bacterium]MBW2259651.1 RnfABCDGE type electron transport complex subunit G [Deltaproteobacteria bacterium]
MRDIIRMIVVLGVMAAISGSVLAGVKSGTAAKIEYQQLKFVKGPAIKAIMEGCTNDPLVDRFKIAHGDSEKSFYVGVFDGKAKSVAFEASGKGFGGDIGIMIGIDLETDQILGAGVTTHSETPGLGSRAKDDPSFGAQFKGMSIEAPFKVKTDGGEIDAVSGATITSQGVCVGMNDGIKVYNELKSQIEEEIKAFEK